MIIEQTIYEYLDEQMSVPVFLELPEVPSESYPTMPERFLVLEKVGGSSENQIGHASVAVQSYSTNSMYEAAELDDEVRTVMPGIVAEEDISGIRLASNYNHTDTRTKRYRYQSVFELHY